ncbi:MAG: hypothetical protein ACFHX7_13295 [Pseudomonadota bacterium]
MLAALPDFGAGDLADALAVALTLGAGFLFAGVVEPCFVVDLVAVALGLAAAFGFAAVFGLAAVFGFAAAFGLAGAAALVAAFDAGLVVFALGVVFDTAFTCVFAFTLGFALDLAAGFTFCLGAAFALALTVAAAFVFLAGAFWTVAFFTGDFFGFAAIDHPFRRTARCCSKSSSERYQNIYNSPRDIWQKWDCLAGPFSGVINDISTRKDNWQVRCQTAGDTAVPGNEVACQGR